ncbi:hypothetical protein [Schlesneria paludicola]|uniref:hypothetical protein n=1 Tax=Schlesneria paludicola TaxID=360056 RepID=UPI0002EE28C0|nr:hypothetical protein [Schlesneria paludicola]
MITMLLLLATLWSPVRRRRAQKDAACDAACVKGQQLYWGMRPQVVPSGTLGMF